ncbi:MAG: DUF3160 domain-containing protein [Polyangiales bacterium]
MRSRLALLALPCLIACGDKADPTSAEPDGGSQTPDAAPIKPDAAKPDAAAPDAGPAPLGGKAVDPTRVKVQPLAVDQTAFDALAAQRLEASKLDGAGLRAKYPVSFGPALTYDPLTAGGLEKIGSSRFALSEGERTKLGKNGFVISTRNTFPSFVYGMAQLYSEHLPLYVSADSLLESVHASYDDILLSIEYSLLVPELKALLQGMRSRLLTQDVDASVKADVDVYLAVADALLRASTPQLVAGGDRQLASTLVELGTKATPGVQQVTLFGVERKEDFSQFEPRGHYTQGLQAYFKAMMWLGRFDFRLLETKSDGTQQFRRPQYLAMLALRELMDSDLGRYQKIDETLRTFVGESDYMTPEQVDKLVADLGGAQAARAATDQQVVDAIIAGGYGKQNILSTIAPPDGPSVLPLNRSFAMLGQRYIVDSHVFHDVTHDRVSRRMMPTPLDPAFAALQNAQALALHPQLDYPGLAGALASSRLGVDAHDQAFWGANLYNLWLTSLRALSPTPTPNTALPELMGTEAWGRRLLNAQLGSWAELRHDTILYAKQSYSGMPVCEFPDAYVDPYPAFFKALQTYADAGTRVAKLFPTSEDDSTPTLVAGYFDNLKRASVTLGEMVDRELRGEPFSAEQMLFINDAVRIERTSQGCTSIDVPDGWYADLYYNRNSSIEFDPTIADVHTQPFSEGGGEVGKVLHVGTGFPRLMVATLDTCNGPRAYAGLVYAYHEQITEDFKRLTDEDWSKTLSGGPAPADVPWVSDLLAQ